MSEEQGAEGEGGGDLSSTASRLSASLFEGLHLRLELFSLELAEERRRVAAQFASLLVAAFAALLFVLSINVVVLVVFWEDRVTAAVCLSLFYLVVALASFAYHRRHGRRGSTPFAATMEVLARDRRSLTGGE